jgi:hypothetical protein
VGAVLLESIQQPVLVIHRSHSSVVAGHTERPAKHRRCDSTIEETIPWKHG